MKDVFLISSAVCVLAGYITHLYWSLSGLFTGSMEQMNEYVIAVLGAFIPPIGIIHGIYLWF